MPSENHKGKTFLSIVPNHSKEKRPEVKKPANKKHEDKVYFPILRDDRIKKKRSGVKKPANEGHRHPESQPPKEEAGRTEGHRPDARAPQATTQDLEREFATQQNHQGNFIETLFI
jgi:hypothetical protein